jgi:hypothetical protein
MSIKQSGVLDISESFNLPTTGSLSLWVIPLDDNSIYNPSGLICEFNDGSSKLILGNSGDNYYITANINGVPSSIYFPDSGGLSHCSLYWNNDSQTGIFYLNNTQNIINNFTVPSSIIPTGHFYPTSGLSEVGLWSTDISAHQQELYNQFNNTHFNPSNLELYYPLGGLYGNNLNDYSKNKKNLYSNTQLCCDIYILEISGVDTTSDYNNSCSGSECLDYTCNSLNGTFIVTPPLGSSSTGLYYVDLSYIPTDIALLALDLSDGTTCIPGCCSSCSVNGADKIYYLPITRSTGFCDIADSTNYLIGSVVWVDGFSVEHNNNLYLNFSDYQIDPISLRIEFNITVDPSEIFGTTYSVPSFTTCDQLYGGVSAVGGGSTGSVLIFPTNPTASIIKGYSYYRLVFNSMGVLLRIELLTFEPSSIDIENYAMILKYTEVIWENLLEICGSNGDFITYNETFNGVPCSRFNFSQIACSGNNNTMWLDKHIPPLLKYSS